MTGTSITKTLLIMAGFGVIGVTPLFAGTRESVREILGGRHPIPMTADQWLKLGVDVDLQLIEAASDVELRYGVRQRAMSGLAVLGGARAKEFLRQTIERGKLAPELLSSAVYSYARGFSATDPGDVRFVSVPLLDHVDWVVRQGAVRALAELGTKEAREALRDRLTRESHPAVQSALRKALGQSESQKR